MTTKARIFRAPKGKDRLYFSMRCDTAQDTTLTWAARGMLAYFLSLQDGWEVTTKDLQQNCGRDKVYKIIKELVDAKYIVHTRVQKADGTFTWGDYQVYERPHTEKPEMEPFPEKPEVDELREPFPEKPYTVNTESKDLNSSLPKRTISGSDEPEGEQTTPSVVSPFRALQGWTVEIALGGNKRLYSKAGDIANWALCQNDKTQWINFKPDRPFTEVEWLALLLWYQTKNIPFPSKPETWNNQAHQFRRATDKARWLKAAQDRINPPAPSETQTASMGLMGFALEVAHD